MTKNQYTISLHMNSECLYGKYVGYSVYSSLSRVLARDIKFNTKPYEEIFLTGIMKDKYCSIFGIIRIEGTYITGFYPCNTDIFFKE